MAYENNIRGEVDGRWTELQKSQDDQLRNVKDAQKVSEAPHYSIIYLSP